MTGRARVLRLVGELTVHTAAERKAEVLAAVEAGPRLDLDLSGVEEIDTAGLQVLMLARREAARADRYVRLVKPSAAVADALSIVRLGLDLEPVA